MDARWFTTRKSKSPNIPGDEEEFLPFASILLFEVEVVDCPARLSFRKVGYELLPVRGLRRLVDDNLRQIGAQLGYHISPFLLELERLVGLDDFRGNGDARGLVRI